MIVFLMLGTLGNLSAQITLFKGTFDEALKKAQQERICSWTFSQIGVDRAK
mgnify:CR=1 FL=1